MLKGVNRMVLEINQPENKYFEKIILFVKPEFSGMQNEKLKKYAERAIEQNVRPPASRQKKSSGSLWRYLAPFLAAGAGAGIMAAAEMIFK